MCILSNLSDTVFSVSGSIAARPLLSRSRARGRALHHTSPCFGSELGKRSGKEGSCTASNSPGDGKSEDGKVQVKLADLSSLCCARGRGRR